MPSRAKSGLNIGIAQRGGGDKTSPKHFRAFFGSFLFRQHAQSWVGSGACQICLIFFFGYKILANSALELNLGSQKHISRNQHQFLASLQENILTNLQQNLLAGYGITGIFFMPVLFCPKYLSNLLIVFVLLHISLISILHTVQKSGKYKVTQILIANFRYILAKTKLFQKIAYYTVPEFI